jgi:hypothetical protein
MYSSTYIIHAYIIHAYIIHAYIIHAYIIHAYMHTHYFFVRRLFRYSSSASMHQLYAPTYEL